MPETADSDFTWHDFVARTNNELVATWGNLAHRVLTFTYRNFDGKVPEPGALDSASEALLSSVEAMLRETETLLGGCHFRAALSAAMAVAQEANKYLDDTAPWKTLANDREATARSLYTALCAINGLKIAFYPFVPFSSQRLHGYLGFDTPFENDGWSLVRLTPGQPLREPKPLFTKLEPEIAEQEEERLTAHAAL